MVRLGQTNSAGWKRMHPFLKEAGLVNGALDMEGLLFDLGARAREEAKGGERTQKLILTILLSIRTLGLPLRRKAMKRN